MSQLRPDFSSQISKSYHGLRFTWQEFVSLILELTIIAYQRMKMANVVQASWEEDMFTVNLEVCIRNVIFDGNYPIQVQSFKKRITSGMLSGEETIKKSKIMDLVIYQNWERDSNEVHFVWEAKRVCDKRVESSYPNLNSEYVNEAIYRFIEREYAEGLEDAGILGYVLAGEVGNIVDDINQSMGQLRVNKPLPATNNLRLAPAINQFEDIYESAHIRTDNSSIQLYHLFLTFDFAPSA